MNGFEERLLGVLTEMDQQRSVTEPALARRRRWHRPAVIGGAVAAVVLAGAATATAARLLSQGDFGIAGTQVVAGHPVGLKGNGCAAGAVVTIRLDGGDIGTTQADAEGYFFADPTVPAGTPLGSHAISARCDGVHHDATIEVIAQPPPAPPSLSVPGPAAAGASIGVKGWGCQVGAPVDVRLDGQPGGTATAAAEGLFYLDLAIPARTTLGLHTVEATCLGPDGTPLTLTSELTVIAPAPDPGPVLAVGDTATPGGPFYVKGLGCRPGAEVTFRLDGGAAVGQTTADPEGYYYASLTAPASVRPGRHELTATCTGADGQDLTLSTDLTITP